MFQAPPIGGRAKEWSEGGKRTDMQRSTAKERRYKKKTMEDPSVLGTAVLRETRKRPGEAKEEKGGTNRETAEVKNNGGQEGVPQVVLA